MIVATEDEGVVLISFNKTGGCVIPPVDQETLQARPALRNVAPAILLIAGDVRPDVRPVADSLQFTGEIPIIAWNPQLISCSAP